MLLIDMAENKLPCLLEGLLSSCMFRHSGSWFDDHGGLGHKTWFAWPRDPVIT